MNPTTPPIHEQIAELALENGTDTSKKAIFGLLEQLGIEIADDNNSVDAAIELAMANGVTADQLASSIWGAGMSWDAVAASYARGQEAFEAIWLESGYTFQHTGGGCTGVTTIVDGVLFMMTTTDGSCVPNPDFACLVGTYDPSTFDYLNVMQEAESKEAAERVLPAMASEAIKQLLD